MSKTARVLRFPERVTKPCPLSPDEIRASVEAYLLTPVDDRSPELLSSLLAGPEILFSLCDHFRNRRDSEPAEIAGECGRLYLWLRANMQSVGLFDESDYLLGEIALIAAGACRLLGRRDDAELWLDRAEGGYRHTVNAGPLLANVSYERISLQFEKGLHSRVLELLPSLSESFVKFGMDRESFKCGLVEVMSLTATSRKLEARGRLEEMRRTPSLSREADLEGAVFMELGESLSSDGQHQEAGEYFHRALHLLKTSNKPVMLAHLKSVIGESLRQQGQLVDAAEAYRAAIADYAGMAMATWVAYLRVVLSETLVALGRPREAEWEILQALPTIEEQKMVPEGFAAVALLRESVKRRNADPNALRDLREHLQKQN
jgi:tetratricopeptide (TPR) repeat protein